MGLEFPDTMPKIVALLTDYGTKDQYAGSLRGAKRNEMLRGI